MGNYHKVTKNNIDFPKYCYYFISEIIDSLEENEIENPGDELSLEIETPQHPYCYDAMELIVRTLQRKGYSTRIPNFSMKIIDGVKNYIYTWKIIKTSNDGLPF